MALCICFKCEKEFTRKPATSGKYCSLKCSNSHKDHNKTAHNKKLNNIKLYYNNPILCKYCDTPILYSKKRESRFCNASCSAKFNAPLRSPRTLEQRQKVSNTLRAIYKASPRKLKEQRYSTINKEKYLYTRIYFITCIVCKKLTGCKSERKTCSEICRRARFSQTAKNNILTLKFNRGRHKKSYLESSFENWLILTYPNLKFETEKTFRFKKANKWYYCDFVFESLKLIIELDGSQHEQTVEYDKLKDRRLRGIGYKVIRVTHKEYQDKSKLDIISNILSV